MASAERRAREQVSRTSPDIGEVGRSDRRSNQDLKTSRTLLCVFLEGGFTCPEKAGKGEAVASTDIFGGGTKLECRHADERAP